MGPVKLIVNADDLGASPEINDETFSLINHGLVTSATLIANSPNISEACKRTSQFPACSFGVHLNLTEFAPLSGSGALGPILNGQGEFNGEDGIRSVKIDSALSNGIYEEFASQIGRLRSLGVQVDHIDSHHHVHNIPRILMVLKKIQKTFQIRKVRISRNVYGVNERAPLALRLKKTIYNAVLRHYYATKTTQGFSDFLLFHENAMAGKIKHRTFEAMVHPGNPYYSQDEVDLLRGSWKEELSFPVELISYGRLG